MGYLLLRLFFFIIVKLLHETFSHLRIGVMSGLGI